MGLLRKGEWLVPTDAMPKDGYGNPKPSEVKRIIGDIGGFPTTCPAGAGDTMLMFEIHNDTDASAYLGRFPYFERSIRRVPCKGLAVMDAARKAIALGLLDNARVRQSSSYYTSIKSCRFIVRTTVNGEAVYMATIFQKGKENKPPQASQLRQQASPPAAPPPAPAVPVHQFQQQPASQLRSRQHKLDASVVPPPRALTAARAPA
jgi:hypothetical protein